MKVFNIVFAVVAVAALMITECHSSKDPAKHAACLQENNLSEEEFYGILKEAKNGSNDIDSRMKCYTHCMLEASQHLDENGKLNLDSLQDEENVTEDDIKIAEECKKEFENVEEKCEYSYQVSICVAKAMAAKNAAVKALLEGESAHMNEEGEE